jgi:N-acetylglucosamine kinase-like BadF-type ATPase
MKQRINGANKIREDLILAIDGGGTNCRAILSTMEGYVLASAQSGSCNYQSVGLDIAMTNIKAAINKVIQVTGQPLALKSAVFGLAGIDTRKDRRIVRGAIDKALDQLGLISKEIIVDNDGMITLLGAIGCEDGVLVMAGTGSIACGMTKQGGQVRAGGWGHLLDDAGSGYAIGKAALTHVMYVYDGRDPQSGLVKAVLDKLVLAGPEEMVNWTYSQDYSVDKVAALAPEVCRLAQEGDWKSLDILLKASQSLKQLSMAVIDRLELRESPFKLMLSGGLLQNVQILRNELVKSIKVECPHASIVEAQYPPICGGILRALLHENIDHQQVLKNLNEQLLGIR